MVVKKSTSPRPNKTARPVRAIAAKVVSRPAPVKPPVQAAPAARKPPKLRVRLVRDGFTMPEADFALIAALKSRAIAARRETKKSELLRAGLHVLTTLDETTLLATLDRLVQVKTGRPKKAH